MNVKLVNGRSAALADVERLAAEVGAVPKPLLDFVREHDGATPESNTFTCGGAICSGVQSFIPIRDILDERANLENLPPAWFPIAWAEGGNYVCIDVVTETVYFWDHEQPTQVVQLASGFAAFLEALQPFNPRSIKLKPEQVKSAWIDPDFLRTLEQ